MQIQHAHVAYIVYVYTCMIVPLYYMCCAYKIILYNVAYLPLP